MLRATYRTLEWILEWITIALMIALSVVVIVAVGFRLAGDSLSWYDEIAAIALAWVTYYGAALAALKRNHIGFDSVLLAIPLPARMAAVVIAEIAVIGFFLIMTWAGVEVLNVLEDTYLISLTWVPVQLTQSVIPIGGALFIVAELLSLPVYWRSTKRGHSFEHPEFNEEA
ncbi:MAG: TRAP transporter small permease subunit [Kiloniellaceae bacterium]